MSGDGVDLSFSSDGSSWSPHIESLLFEDGGVMSPGDVFTDTLWIRNDAAEAASVVIHDDGTSTTAPWEMSVSHAFQLKVGSGDGATSVAVSELEPCQPILQTDLQPDEVARVDVALELPFEAGDTVEGSSVDVKLGVAGNPGHDPADNHVCGARAGSAAPDDSTALFSEDLNLSLLLALLVLGAVLVRTSSRLRDRAQRNAEVTTSAASRNP